MKEFLLCVKSINKFSRIYIKAGSVIVFALFFSAIFCYIGLGKFGNYDYLLFLKDELFFCGKEMMGAVYVPALIIEILSLAEKIQL